MTELTEHDIQARKLTLLNNLQPQNQCFTSKINSFIATLDRIHPDVMISHGKNNIFDVAIWRVFMLLKETLNAEPTFRKIAIFDSWSNVDPIGVIGAAKQFKKEFRDSLKTKLTAEFQELLPEGERKDNIISGLQFRMRPQITDDALQQTLKEIRDLPNDTKSIERQDAIQSLQNQVKKNYDDSYLTFAEIKTNLMNTLQCFKALDNAAKEFTSFTAKYNGENVKSLQAIENAQAHIKEAYIWFEKNPVLAWTTLYENIIATKQSLVTAPTEQGAWTFLSVLQSPSEAASTLEKMSFQHPFSF